MQPSLTRNSSQGLLLSDNSDKICACISLPDNPNTQSVQEGITRVQIYYPPCIALLDLSVVGCFGKTIEATLLIAKQLKQPFRKYIFVSGYDDLSLEPTLYFLSGAESVPEKVQYDLMPQASFPDLPKAIADTEAVFLVHIFVSFSSTEQDNTRLVHDLLTQIDTFKYRLCDQDVMIHSPRAGCFTRLSGKKTTCFDLGTEVNKVADSLGFAVDHSSKKRQQIKKPSQTKRVRIPEIVHATVALPITSQSFPQTSAGESACTGNPILIRGDLAIPIRLPLKEQISSLRAAIITCASARLDRIARIVSSNPRASLSLSLRTFTPNILNIPIWVPMLTSNCKTDFEEDDVT
eukprot:gene9514-10397_t